MANPNKKRNCLTKIKINGLWLTKEQEIQRGVVTAYQNLLSDFDGWRLSLNGLDFERIGVEKEASLEHGRKHRDILCIKGYGNNICWRNIVLAKFLEKSPKIDDISRYIGDMAINHRYFVIYRMFNAGQRRSNALQCSATVHLQCFAIVIHYSAF